MGDQSAIELRFWAKVDRSPGLGPKGDCWIWTAALFRSTGYGMFQVGGRAVGAHRFSYGLAFGSIPDRGFVRHDCDNRLCVRPAHLRTGSHEQNMQDMAGRGRAARGERHGLRLHPGSRPVGARNGRAVVTAAIVEQIRESYQRGEATQRELAAQHGLGKSQVSNIIRGKSWR